MLGSSDLKHLKELAEKHGAEGEKLLEGTYDGKLLVSPPFYVVFQL